MVSDLNGGGGGTRVGARDGGLAVNRRGENERGGRRSLGVDGGAFITSITTITDAIVDHGEEDGFRFTDTNKFEMEGVGDIRTGRGAGFVASIFTIAEIIVDLVIGDDF